MKSITNSARMLRAGTAVAAMATILATSPANAIVPNETTDSEAIVDDEGGVNGIGQFFRSDGSVCTGSLINARTVLFAAHCVNDRPETDFDGTNIASAFSFNANALPGLQNWFTNGFTTNTALNVFNISRIQYDPRSLLNPDAQGFIEADIALATLDTPAAGIPTWALLFSPLPNPGATGPGGTGYHVNISGFGGTGNALDGAVDGIDFRRRAAENLLGAFASLDDINNALGQSDAFFGPGGNTLPQNLYVIDFDSQDGNTGADFNILRDPALPNEGTTAGGDSGGPLILDAANNAITNEDLLIGTLSGGSRSLNVPFSSLGTTSFYQPVFLYWQFIAETNPYRYVGAAEGDGDWEDASHWVSLLDPNYRIIDDAGNIVNGIPDTPELGLNGTEGDFGAVCAEGIITAVFGRSNCTDLATGETFDTTPPPATPDAEAGIADATVTSGIATVDLEAAGLQRDETEAATATAPASSYDGIALAAADDAVTAINAGLELAPEGTTVTAINAAIDLAPEGETNTAIDADADLDGSSDVGSNIASVDLDQFTLVATNDVQPQEDGMDMMPDDDAGPPALPPATIDNGLPGATGFVPDNIEDDVAGGIIGRFFDVTLSNAGTTTLSSMVEIDNLTVTGAAGLNIAENASLNSILGINQTGGLINVDGRLSGNGDFTLFAGMLTGTGTVATPFTTNIAGVISPAGMGTIGTLNFEGNLVLASASTYLLDLDDMGNSDLITVTASDVPGSGVASIGGTVLINPLTNFLFNDGDTYTILTAETALDGEFATGFGSNSAVLDPTFNTVSNDDGSFSVQLVFNVSDYVDVVDQTSAVQTSYAALLDANRANGLAALPDIFTFTEGANAADLGATLEGLAPFTETTRLSIAEMLVNSLMGFNRNRLATAFSDERGGSVAINANPLQLAVASNNGAPVQQAFASATSAAPQADNASNNTNSGVDSNFALFFSGGYLEGQGQGMPSALTTGPDNFNGYFFSGGLEYFPTESSIIGVSLAYADIDGSSQQGQTADGELIQGTVYGAIKTGGIIIDGQASIGSFSTDTSRTVAVGANSFDLATSDDSLTFSAEVGISGEIKTKTVRLIPRAAINYATVNFDDVAETGGAPALNIQRDSFDTLQGRAGVTLTGKAGSKIQPWVRADYVHDFQDRDNSFGAGFAGGSGAFAPFAIASDDSDWAELGAGLSVTTGNIVLGVSVETTVGRDDFQNQSYQGSIRFKF
ncbi:autotransporter domain-containing protein [Parasphingorhabdus sp. DH2-15]|uniref:autotransporter domain-containing protein n=1 Tax=Parasphingorhabdus sp. DH2-15 TaxID=3444112 RepID=UPI003F687CEA